MAIQIRQITPYAGDVPVPGQAPAVFSQNSQDQLGFMNSLADELVNTISDMNNSANEMEVNAQKAESAVNTAEAILSGNGYQGLWPDNGGSALKGETWQTQVGGTPTGDYYTALKNTSDNPVDDNDNWKINITKKSFGSYTNLDFDTLHDAINSEELKDGYSVTLKERTAGSGGGGVWDVFLTSSVTPNTYNIVQCVSDPSLSLALRVGAIVDVTQFGAKGLGSTHDDTGAFSAARAYSVNVFCPTPPVSYHITSDLEGNFYGDHSIRFSGDGLVTFTDLSEPRPARDMRCISHRGYTGALAENTLPGIMRAVRNGADIVEIDVQVTSDGVVVLYHDSTLDAKTNGTGTVAFNTFATINSLVFDDLAGTPLSSTRIPTLARVLDKLSLYNNRVIIEIKGYRTDDDLDLVLDAIITAGMQDFAYILVNSQSDLTRIRTSTNELGSKIPIWIGYANQHTWKDFYNYAKSLGGEYEFIMYHQNIRGGGASMVNEINLYSRLNAYWLVANGTSDSDHAQLTRDMQTLGVDSVISDQNINQGG